MSGIGDLADCKLGEEGNEQMGAENEAVRGCGRRLRVTAGCDTGSGVGAGDGADDSTRPVEAARRSKKKTGERLSEKVLKDASHR